MQTKLSVALAATLAGFALSAQAANVEVYGLIDTGLNYQHVDADRAGVDDAEPKISARASRSASFSKASSTATTARSCRATASSTAPRRSC